MENKVLENELFTCEHLTLSRNTLQDIDDFKVTVSEGIGLMEYLRDKAFQDENNHSQRIYLVRDKYTGELAAYFGLRAGLISSNERTISVDGCATNVFDVIPGVEISVFAVNESYILNHSSRKGCGLIIFHDFILKIVQEARELIGCEVIYGFSVDTDGKLLKRYIEDYKFMRLDEENETKLHNRLRSKYDKGCVFIYQKI